MLELCESAQPDRHSRSRAAAIFESNQPDDQIEAQMSKLSPRSRVSPGYCDWALYLVWLEQMLSRGIEFQRPLTAEEADGLVAIGRARDQFQAENPPCPDCGDRVRRGTAHRCKQKFMRERMGR
jgi:hypothetical protein